MENEIVLKIATLNLNGETWCSINRRPRLPQKLFSIQSIKKELTNLTKTGLKNLLKGGEYDVIAIQELIYTPKEINAIKKAIEGVKDASKKQLYELLLPNNLGGHTHFTVGFIVKKQLSANLKNENQGKNGENFLGKNRISVLELTINGKKYSLINMHVNNHNIDIPNPGVDGNIPIPDDAGNIPIPVDVGNTILLGDMNACTENQATDNKAVNDNFLKKIESVGWSEIGGNDNYTWKSNNIEKKLDHIYICKASQKEKRKIKVKKKKVNFYYDKTNGFTDHSMLVSTLVFY